jgi:hypothetical protein
MNCERDLNDLVPLGTILFIDALFLWRPIDYVMTHGEGGVTLLEHISKHFLEEIDDDDRINVVPAVVVGKLLTRVWTPENFAAARKHQVIPTTIVLLGNGETWYVHSTYTSLNT